MQVKTPVKLAGNIISIAGKLLKVGNIGKEGNASNGKFYIKTWQKFKHVTLR